MKAIKKKSGGGRKNEVFYDPDREDDDDLDSEEEENEGASHRKRKRPNRRNDAKSFIEIEAEVDSDGEEDDDDDHPEDDDFIVDTGADLNPKDDDGRTTVHRRPLLPSREDEEEENMEDFERRIKERYQSYEEIDDGDDGGSDEIDQQALLPCVRDPKLWMVKCAIGHERELALCLMHKSIDRDKTRRDRLLITSAIARDNLKGFVYVEAEKEAHVREACKGIRFVVVAQKIMTIVPINEMTGVVSAERKKGVEVERGSWVRVKRGVYDGDVGKVVDVNDVRGRVTVMLVPRIDLEALARKLEGRRECEKRAFRVPARLMSVDKAKVLGIQVEGRRNRATGDYFEKIDGMLFRDGFLYRTMSKKSICWSKVNPTLVELENFRERTGRIDGDGDSVFSVDRKAGKFMKGDAVVVVKGELKNLVGKVVKVEEEIVHIKPEINDLTETLVISRNELCKLFRVGDHVKVISGVQEGATGMVVNVDEQRKLLTIVSDSTKQHICVFADDVVESCDVSSDVGKVYGFKYSRVDRYRTPRMTFSRVGRGHDANGLGAGTRVKIRQGFYKGCRGRVVEVKGQNLLVELESQMKTVTVDRRGCASDSDNLAAVGTPYRHGSETPMHPSSTPLHPYMATPMRDPRATPIHDGMRTPLI